MFHAMGERTKGQDIRSNVPNRTQRLPTTEEVYCRAYTYRLMTQ